MLALKQKLACKRIERIKRIKRIKPFALSEKSASSSFAVASFARWEAKDLYGAKVNAAL